MTKDHIIDASHLQSRLQGDNPPIMVDGTYSAEGFAAFLRQRIGKTAVFFDIDEIADSAAPLPHTVPDAVEFASKVGALGLRDTDDLVIYDQSGVYMAAARVWWLFRLFGHKGQVQVLNGGLPAWMAAGGALEQDTPSLMPTQLPSATYLANFQPHLLMPFAELLATHASPDIKVLDARPAGRFTGQMAEPRPGMRPGHIPHSVNLPFMQLLNASGAFPDKATLAEYLKTYTDTPEKLVATCGSGVTACVLALALAEAGRDDVAIYDGSWSEWGDIQSGTPVALS